MAKTFKSFTEDRDPDLNYQELNPKGKPAKSSDDVSKVVVELKQQKAGAATKLASQLEQALREKKELDAKIDQLKDKSRDIFSELFSVADEAYTRVVETASLTLTLSKATTRASTKFDVDAFFEEVTKQVMPEVLAVLLKLKDQFTETKETPVASTVTPKLKSEGALSGFVRWAWAKLNRAESVLNRWKQRLGLSEHIKKVGDKWRVVSKSGKNMGTYDSKAAARKRLGQVEYFKAHSK